MGFVRARAEEVKSFAVSNFAIPLISADVAKFMGSDAGGGENN